MQRFIKQIAIAGMKTGEEAVEAIRFQTDTKDRLQYFLMLRPEEDEEKKSRITSWSGTLKLEWPSRIRYSAAVVGLAGTGRRGIQA